MTSQEPPLPSIFVRADALKAWATMVSLRVNSPSPRIFTLVTGPLARLGSLYLNPTGVLVHPDAGSVINGKAYGFDGTTVLFPNADPVLGPDGRSYDCETVDALELR